MHTEWRDDDNSEGRTVTGPAAPSYPRLCLFCPVIWKKMMTKGMTGRKGREERVTRGDENESEDKERPSKEIDDND